MDAEKAIEIVDVYKEFKVGFRMKTVRAVNGISLDVEKGNIYGFLGPNGAGKTTTIKMLLSLIKPSSGKIKVWGNYISDYKVRAKVGFMPENPYFYDYLTGNEFLDLAARLYHISAKERKSRIDELLNLVGLKNSGTRQLRKYSKGMLQRIGLAQAMIAKPSLLILDEPMSGLDPIGRREIRDLIISLRNQKTTIFFSSHILTDVELLCDQVAIINKGKIVASGDIQQLLKPAQQIVDIEITGLQNFNDIDDIIKDKVSHGNIIRLSVLGQENAEKTLKYILEKKGNVISFVSRRETLEDIFMRNAMAIDKND